MTNRLSHRPGRWGSLSSAEEIVCPVSGDSVDVTDTNIRSSEVTLLPVYDKLRVFVLPNLMPLSYFVPANESSPEMDDLSVHSVMTSWKPKEVERDSTGHPTLSTYSLQGILLKEGRKWRFDRLAGSAVASETFQENVRGSLDASNWERQFRTHPTGELWLGTCDLSISGRDAVKVLSGHDTVAAMPSSASNGSTLLMWDEEVKERTLASNGISDVVRFERQSGGLKKVMKLMPREEAA